MTDRQQALFLVFIQVVLFALLAAALTLLPAGRPEWALWLGAALVALGLLVGAAALLTYFMINHSLVNVSPEPDQNAQLVEYGIYAFIRHPIYTGVMLCALGAAAAHGHGISLALAAILCGFFTYKSVFEERWLMRVYPGYAAYRQRAGRFLPRILR